MDQYDPNEEQFEDDYDEYDEQFEDEYDDEYDEPEQPWQDDQVVMNDQAGMTKRVTTVRGAVPPANGHRPDARSGSGSGSGGGKNSAGLAVFYVVTLLLGVVACIAAFALVFNSMRDDEGKSKTSEQPTASVSASAEPAASEAASEEPAASEPMTAVSMLLAVNTENRTISVYDATNQRQRGFEVTTDVALKDKFGQEIVLGYLAVGDVVDITLEAETDVLQAVQISAQAWKQENLTGAVVNAATQTVSIGGKQYTYSDHLLVTYQGNPFDITKLDPAHSFSMCEYESEILSLEVLRAFGYVAIAGNADIMNGKVQIGEDSYTLAEVKEPIKLVEGKHKVVVTGQNIDKFEREVNITAGNTVDVSLRDVKIKSGQLRIRINEPDAVVRIDGVLKNVAEPITLAHGTYTLRVEKEGFEPYEAKLNFREASSEVAITLQRIVQMKTFRITTDPGSGLVYVDNTYIGVAPVTVTAEYGPHTIKAQKPGYFDAFLPVEVSDEMPNPTVTLRQIDVEAPEEE